MGTNFYLHVNVCPHCKRAERRIHVGKSSGGWTFSFRGDRHGHDVGKPILCYADWLTFLEEALAAGKSELRDEYGHPVTLPEFKALVESKRDAPRNHTTYCLTHHPDQARHNWLDPEGYSFSEGEFS